MVSTNQSGWEALQTEVHALIEINRKLALENQRLRQLNKDWVAERNALLAKHELAKSRVEAMIGRLKGMEH